MSGVIGWLVGSGTLNEADAKTSPLVTRGLGAHPRFLPLHGWTHPYGFATGRRVRLQGPSTARVTLRGPRTDRTLLVGP